MSKKFGGLGKGLDSLIPDIETEVSEEQINYLSMDMITPNKGQPRKYFDEEKIAQLAESIKIHGVIQPIIVQRTGYTYSIIAGERRWRACKSIDMKEIPAIVMNMSDTEVLEISLIENIQREDLNPIEEAVAFKKLIDEFNVTQAELGGRLGKSRTSITNTLRLLGLDKRVQDYLMDGVISEGHGRALLGITDGEMQYELSQKIIDEKLSVREVERLIKKLGEVKQDEEKAEKVENENLKFIENIRNSLENHFGTKVKLNDKNNKGKIEIEYYSSEDLNRILDILNIKE